MRTTISISEHLLAAAKLRARQRGLTLGDLVEEALQVELSDDRKPQAGPEIPSFKDGTGPHPGIDPRSNRALQEVLDRDLDLVDRR